MRAVRNLLSLGCAVLGAGTGHVYAQLSASEMHDLESKLPPSASGKIDFEKQISPILQNSCIRCHGPERPKSNFRLDSRDDALKGGKEGIDIIPGKSASSPLIYYVARLAPDMEMPPDGKGDPLTPEQVSLLRAWIDQGANWPAGINTNRTRIQFAANTTLQWFTVKGNEQKFREHTGIQPGFGGGIDSIYIQEQVSPDRLVTFEGRILTNPEEYKLKLTAEQRDFGWIQAGAEQYREYYADSGDYYPFFDPPAFSLGNNLHMDIGRAWIEAGLARPDGPKLVFGYEYQYRDGSKSILQWGDVGTIEPEFNLPTTDAKKIYPASKSINERVHVFKFDVTHEIKGIGIENQFRAELYDQGTSRQTMGYYNLDTATAQREFAGDEGNHNFQGSDSIRLDKQIRDWLYVSGGYFFSKFDGNYTLNVQPAFPNGEFPSVDRYYFTDSIVLDQSTHVFNANTQLGPWSGLTIYAGLQNEWMSQTGFGAVRLDEGFPSSFGGPAASPAILDANLDRRVFQEYFGARYTALPWTVLFADARFAQEKIGQTEERDGAGLYFFRDTDAYSELESGRIGFTISPWTRASLTTEFRKQAKDWDYNHLADIDEQRGSSGYSAFITGRGALTDQISTKLTLRPASWIKVGLNYQLVASDSTTGTEPIPAGEIGSTPGGDHYAANYDASIYGATIAFTPWHRIQVSSAFNWEHSRTATGHDFYPVIVDYMGDVYSSISTLTYILNSKTDLTAAYTYSWADYSQDNYAAGLPLGLAYDWHQLSAGITRHWRKNLSTNLQYQFYSYNEPATGGINDYVAHGILASLTMTFK